MSEYTRRNLSCLPIREKPLSLQAHPQALAEEYRTRGLRVLALCPGATETAFFDVAGEAASFGRRRTPEQVVATGLRALERGRSVVIDGFFNSLAAQLTRFFPRRFIARMAGLSVRPRQMPGATQRSAHQ